MQFCDCFILSIKNKELYKKVFKVIFIIVQNIQGSEFKPYPLDDACWYLSSYMINSLSFGECFIHLIPFDVQKYC